LPVADRPGRCLTLDAQPWSHIGNAASPRLPRWRFDDDRLNSQPAGPHHEIDPQVPPIGIADNPVDLSLRVTARRSRRPPKYPPPPPGLSQCPPIAAQIGDMEGWDRPPMLPAIGGLYPIRVSVEHERCTVLHSRRVWRRCSRTGLDVASNWEQTEHQINESLT
jgi:hypothetical protein